MRAITVAIADDHVLFREGLSALFEQDGRFEIVGHAANGDEAVQVARATEPEILLLDLSMPGPPARTTLATIRRISWRTRVVILTMHDDHALRTRLLDAGACGYWSKSLPSREVIERVVVLASEQRPLLSEASAPTPAAAPAVTPREAEVLVLVALALSNREIAVRLNIAEGTVKRHLNNVFDRLGAVSRLDAVRRAARLGILNLD
jgi:DNA-binding NarL/FixJ family response regulator